MFQGGPLHELFLIAINHQEQDIIGLNKKMVATYTVGELKILI